jgi:hypothetical protein
MQTKQCPVIHQGEFVATVEQRRVWHYVIKRANSGEVVSDGWSGELAEAVESADRQLSLLSKHETELPKTS